MLLFDLDSTLIDSADIWLNIDLDFLKNRGLVHTREYHDSVAHVTMPTAAVFTKEYYSLPESPAEIAAEWKAMALDAYSSRIPLKPYAKEYLEQCAKTGEKMVILTSNTAQLCRAALARHEIDGFFSDFLYAEEFGLEKSNPALFLQVAKQLGASPTDCTLYDDSPVACRAAKDAGMTVIGVYDAFFGSQKEAMQSYCDKYIDSFQDML